MTQNTSGYSLSYTDLAAIAQPSATTSRRITLDSNGMIATSSFPYSTTTTPYIHNTMNNFSWWNLSSFIEPKKRDGVIKFYEDVIQKVDYKKLTQILKQFTESKNYGTSIAGRGGLLGDYTSLPLGMTFTATTGTSGVAFNGISNSSTIV